MDSDSTVKKNVDTLGRCIDNLAKSPAAEHDSVLILVTNLCTDFDLLKEELRKKNWY